MSSAKGKHKQQLQGDIAQALSKVDELRTSFQQYWDRFEHGTPANRDKTEGLLRSELEKMKRLRKQIQAWMELPELATMRSKLKGYTDAIEAEMRRYYILEREMKTKQFSNIALNDENEKRAGPRASTQAWLDLCLTELNNKLEDLRSHIDDLHSQSVGKRNTKMTKVNFADKLIAKIEAHKENLEEIAQAFNEGYITHSDIDLYLKQSLDDVIRTCKSGGDIDATTVIYDDIIELIRTNKEYGMAALGDDPSAESPSWTPTSVKSPNSNKALKDSREFSLKEAPSGPLTASQDEINEIVVSQDTQISQKEATCPTAIQESCSANDGSTTSGITNTVIVAQQASGGSEEGNKSHNTSNGTANTSPRDAPSGSPSSSKKGAQTIATNLPPAPAAKGKPEMMQNAPPVRDIFQAVPQLTKLAPAAPGDNCIVLMPNVTPTAMSLYSLSLPNSLMLCTQPHVLKDVVPDLPHSINTVTSTHFSTEQQSANATLIHNMIQEYKYSERPLTKLNLTSKAFEYERGKPKPYYAYEVSTSMINRQQAARLRAVQKEMAALRTKGWKADKQSSQPSSSSDTNDAGSTSSFDLDSGAAEYALQADYEGAPGAASLTVEDAANRDPLAQQADDESVYPDVYAIKRFGNGHAASYAGHDTAEASWFANRSPQALMWVTSNTEDTRLRQLAAAGLQQQGYVYTGTEWAKHDDNIVITV